MILYIACRRIALRPKKASVIGPKNEIRKFVALFDLHKYQIMADISKSDIINYANMQKKNYRKPKSSQKTTGINGENYESTDFDN